MKASEAIEFLYNVDPDLDVTLVFGDMPSETRNYNPAPYQPHFVPSYVRNPEDVWLSRKPNSQFGDH